MAPMNSDTTVDPVEQILRSANIDDDTKAQAWDAYHSAANVDDFEKRIRGVQGLSDDVKANLWDSFSAKSAPSSQSIHDAAWEAAQRTWNPESAPKPFAPSPYLSKPPNVPSPIPPKGQLPLTWEDAGTFGDLYRKSADFNSAVLDTAVGAAKGLGHSLYGATKLGSKVGVPGTEWAQFTPEVEKISQLNPSNPAQKVGFEGEQIGEYLAPGFGEEEAVAKLGSKLPKFISKLIPKVAYSAATTGAIAGSQAGGDVAEAKAGAAVGAGVPVVGGIVSGLGSKFLPETFINRILKPNAKELTFGKNPAKAVVQEKILAGSLESLRDQIASKLAETGDAMSSLHNQFGHLTVPIQPMLDAVDDEIAKASDPVKGELRQAIQSFRDQLAMRMQHITIPDAVKLKTDIGDVARWTGTSFDKELNQAKVKTYVALKNEINRVVPQLAPLNEHYADLLAARSAVERQIVKEATGSLPKWLTRKVIYGTVGGAIGSELGGRSGGGEGALIGAGVPIAAEAALKNPAFATSLAQASRVPAVIARVTSPAVNAALKKRMVQVDAKDKTTAEDFVRQETQKARDLTR